jgi:hypothetical protein
MVETTRTTGKTAAEANKPTDGAPQPSPSTAGASTADASEARTSVAHETGGHSHIRFVGHPSDSENSATVVFGKQFYRGKWVPLSNLDGGNPDKKALPPEQLAKLIANPAFQLGNGEDTPVPGMGDEGEAELHEEA